MEDMSSRVKRLVSEFAPGNYQLELWFDREGRTFNGIVTITGKKVGRPSKRLTFHQNGLKVTEATITRKDKKGEQNHELARINLHNSSYEVRLHTDSVLFPGEYTVTMAFRGPITPSMQGIYASTFEHDGKEKAIISTQFESHHAREVFPCIDEPAAKATFDLTLNTPKGESVISNAMPKSAKTSGKLTRTVFGTTPRMSTYLLAFAFGEMHSVERHTKDGILMRSWSTVAQPKNYLDYSADEGVKILEYFTEYFGVPYPLEKCDQLAIPDFDAGAMENWGLIIYREIALLADPHNRSISSEQYVSLVVAHELSHQWFGNLVTMEWWDDLWLNESFASLMEYIALDALHPDWQQWEHYTASDVLATTARDVYKDVQAVSVDVTDPDLIETLFDPGIVYAKGGRLLKMMREFIGDDAFSKGLNAYFKEHAYANASREDLWKALNAASGQDVPALMTPWLLRAGMPVLHATQNGDKLTLKQERFLLDGPTDGTVWPVPLLSSAGTSPSLIDKAEAAVTLPDTGYAVLNEHASGHYFVHYTEAAHRTALTKSLQAQTLPPETRINMLNDLYMLARHGDASLTDGLDIVIKCTNEPRDSVWALMSRIILASIQLTEGDKKADAQLKTLRAMLASDGHKRLGWTDAKDDDANTRQLRHTMIALMVAANDPETIKTAVTKYKAAKGLGEIDAELRSTILIAAVRDGGKSVIDHLLKEYPKVSADVQLDITAAATATRDPKLASEAIKKVFGEKGLARPQDVLRWLAMFLRNYYTREVAWDYMVKEWDWIKTTLEHSKAFDYLPIYAAGVISTDDWAKKFLAFFEPKKNIKALTQNIEVGLADITARSAWRKRDEKAIKTWLDAHIKDV